MRQNKEGREPGGKHTDDVEVGVEEDGAVVVFGFTLVHGRVANVHIFHYERSCGHRAPRFFIHFYREGGGKRRGGNVEFVKQKQAESKELFNREAEAH